VKAGKTNKRAHRRALASGEPVFLFPGPEGWEAWSEGESGGIQCLGPSETPAKLRPPPQAVFCLPSRSFFSFPVWVREIEGPPAREQVGLRLEEKGLLGPNPDAAVWGMEPIRSEAIPGPEGLPESRQLEATAVLLPGFEEQWLVETAARHEVAGRTQTPPKGGASAVLRRELGRWVVDFFQQGKWLHTQPLLARTLDAGAALEIAALLAQWESEGVLSGLTQMVVRDDQDHSRLGEFSSALSVPCRIEGRCPPRLPSHPWNLEPPILVEHRQEKAAAVRQKKIIRMVLTGYGVVILLAAAVLLAPWVRCQQVARQLSQIAEPARRIQATALVWREAAGLVDPKHNTLELLWQVSRPLVSPDPPEMEGVQLTVFDLTPRRLVLQGKAADLVKVQAYLEWLKNNPALAGFVWKNSQPRLAADGTATFSAEGVPPQAEKNESDKEELPPHEDASG